jgi:hypothetical protein
LLLEPASEASTTTAAPTGTEAAGKGDLKLLLEKALRENEELKRQIVCKICMDPVYTKPLVSQLSAATLGSLRNSLFVSDFISIISGYRIRISITYLHN